MNEFVTKIKMFTPDNYEKEEEYLREMSLRGWHFRYMRGFFYTFEKGEPVSYCYRLDFMPDLKMEKEYYLKLYEDCGWDHIFEYRLPIFAGRNIWQFFRIKSPTGHEEVLFSDNESKIDLLKRIRSFYTQLTAIMFCLNITNFMRIYDWLVNGVSVTWLILVLYGLIVFIYAKVLIRLNRQIEKLKKVENNKRAL